ncbi:MAG: hypothetical protein EOP00_00140 [Pedobacter sp.]|nr:MAG: hypothetical protein EOP00_00140 [Pedobacter sp.]
MKKYLILLVTIFMCHSAFSQNALVKDIDFDGIKDTVFFEETTAVIICRLSTQKFKVIKSKSISNEYASSYGVRNSKSGFEFFIAYNRYGAVSQFSYEKGSKKIRLIGMKHQESGLTAFDANGKASVNLLVGNYIGNWAYNDIKQENYQIEIPTIKEKMLFKKTYLNDFNERIYDDFLSKSSALFVKYKDAAVKRKIKN